jgi:hypothetical protein
MIFARDRGVSYSSVLFCALDFDVVWLFATMVTVLDICGLNIIQGSIVFYFFFLVFIKWPRSHFGENNVSKKALVDDRFLL